MARLQSQKKRMENEKITALIIRFLYDYPNVIGIVTGILFMVKYGKCFETFYFGPPAALVGGLFLFRRPSHEESGTAVSTVPPVL